MGGMASQINKRSWKIWEWSINRSADAVVKPTDGTKR